MPRLCLWHQKAWIRIPLSLQPAVIENSSAAEDPCACVWVCVKVSDLASTASDNWKQTSSQLWLCIRRINDCGVALQALAHLSFVLWLNLWGRTCTNSIRLYPYQFHLSLDMCMLVADIYTIPPFPKCSRSAKTCLVSKVCFLGLH